MLKIGDKVKIVDLSNSDVPQGYLNAVGVIDAVDKNDIDLPYHVRFGESSWFHSSDVKAVSTVITITSDDKHMVTAECAGKTGVAKCSPDDKFSLSTGVHLALERLWAEPGLRMYSKDGTYRGITGKPTDYKDELGRKLFLGDTVRVYHRRTKKDQKELSLVLSREGSPIVYGLGLHNAESINDDYLIIKERSFDSFVSGDCVHDVTYK